MLLDVRRGGGWCLGLLVMGFAACDDSRSSPPPDASAVTDVGADTGQSAKVDGGQDVPLPPYDAGAAPVCGLTARYGALVPRGGGYTTLEPGQIAPHRLGFVVSWRESAPRFAMPDVAPTQRDAMVYAAVGTDGALVRGRTAVYDSAELGTDVTTPVVVGRGDGSAVLLFNETRLSAGMAGFRTDLRAFNISPNAEPGTVVNLANNHGEGFAAMLPDGTPWMLSSRLTATLDGGVVVARPTSYRIGPDLALTPAGGVDLTGIVPLEAESVSVNATPTGVGLVYRLSDAIRITRFDAQGTVDTRFRTIRDLNPPPLEAAVALADGAVVAWSDAVNGMATVTVAVVSDTRGLLLRREVERFAGETRVALTAAHGGAALVWTRGSGAETVLRGVVVQPDGVLRGEPRDLVTVAGAEGRIVARAEGRSLRFAIRTRGTDGVALGFGQVCLPE